MRIAIYHNLPSGGGKRALYEMTRLLHQNHTVDVYSLTSAEHAFCDIRPYCHKHKMYEFQSLPLLKRPFGRLNQLIRTIDLIRLDRIGSHIAQEIDNEDHEIVFAHTCRFGQSPSILKHLATPAVYYCQEPPRRMFEPAIFRPYDRLTTTQRFVNRLDPFPGIYRQALIRHDLENIKNARLVLVNSDYSRSQVYNLYGIFAQVAYLGVDSDRFIPDDRVYRSGVLFVGAVTPRKGIDFLVESLAILPEEERPDLMIVCNYVEEKELAYIRHLAERKGVSLRIQVNVSDDKLVEAYQSALVTGYAPVMEPFGLVPLESMACGTAVVGVDEAGVRETVLHQITGLVADRDPVDFADALLRSIRESGLRQKLARQGRANVVSNWSWEKSVHNIEQHLFECAGLENQTLN